MNSNIEIFEMKISFTDLIGDIVNNNNTMCTSVVTTGYRTKSFLSSRIPLEMKSSIDEIHRVIVLTICNLIVFPSRSMVRIFYNTNFFL